jgi:hypothetical protein
MNTFQIYFFYTGISLQQNLPGEKKLPTSLIVPIKAVPVMVQPITYTCLHAWAEKNNSFRSPPPPIHAVFRIAFPRWYVWPISCQPSTGKA